MQKPSSGISFSIALSLTILSASAQSTYTFVTSVGSGSFTLNTNNLVFTGDNGTAAGYNDTQDSLTFQGITYTNLDFSVYNNSFIVSGRDGFQILVDKSPYSSSARLEIQVAGNPSVVSGISRADLVTALNSFEALQEGGFSTRVSYNNPQPPYQQQGGTVSAFQLLSQLSMSSAGVQTNEFGFYISGGNGATVVVEVCTSLADQAWSPVQTNTLTGGSMYFKDPIWTNQPSRFYRVKMQ